MVRVIRAQDTSVETALKCVLQCFHWGRWVTVRADGGFGEDFGTELVRAVQELWGTSKDGPPNDANVKFSQRLHFYPPDTPNMTPKLKN